MLVFLPSYIVRIAYYGKAMTVAFNHVKRSFVKANFNLLAAAGPYDEASDGWTVL